MKNIDSNSPIGFFDSGIGGLTVVRSVTNILPNENIVYFGDTARVPYGSKSNSTVIEYSMEAANFLLKKNIKLLVVACNTASSVALETLQNTLSIPVIGMIEPGSDYALHTSQNKIIGVIGTHSTINNKAYSSRLHTLDPNAKVYEKACPLFVPFAEEGLVDHEALRLVAEEYLSELKSKGIDTLVLGCTHYPTLRKIIQNEIGEQVNLIDSGTPAAKIVEDYLIEKGLKNSSHLTGTQEFFVSDVPAKFKEIAERFLGKEISNINKIDLEELIIQR